jgi:hypothetical protein
MNMQGHRDRILDLAQRWKLNLLSKEEYAELNTWYHSLEDVSLGFPDEITVNGIEIRLHQLFTKQEQTQISKNGPPRPI